MDAAQRFIAGDSLRHQALKGLNGWDITPEYTAVHHDTARSVLKESLPELFFGERASRRVTPPTGGPSVPRGLELLHFLSIAGQVPVLHQALAVLARPLADQFPTAAGWEFGFGEFIEGFDINRDCRAALEDDVKVRPAGMDSLVVVDLDNDVEKPAYYGGVLFGF